MVPTTLKTAFLSLELCLTKQGKAILVFIYSAHSLHPHHHSH